MSGGTARKILNNPEQRPLICLSCAPIRRKPYWAVFENGVGHQKKDGRRRRYTGCVGGMCLGSAELFDLNTAADPACEAGAIRGELFRSDSMVLTLGNWYGRPFAHRHISRSCSGQ